MAYDEALADRVVAALRGVDGITTRKMFGGWALMQNGNMLAGVGQGGLMVRVGTARMDEMLQLPGAGPVQMGERTMGGVVLVSPDAVASDEDLLAWLNRGREFTDTLPPKVKAPAKAKPKGD